MTEKENKTEIKKTIHFTLGSWIQMFPTAMWNKEATPHNLSNFYPDPNLDTNYHTIRQ